MLYTELRKLNSAWMIIVWRKPVKAGTVGERKHAPKAALRNFQVNYINGTHLWRAPIEAIEEASCCLAVNLSDKRTEYDWDFFAIPFI